MIYRKTWMVFNNNSSITREKLAEFLTVFRTKYVKLRSMATAKLKFHRPVFNPTNQKINDFLDELKKLAENAVKVAAQVIT